MSNQNQQRQKSLSTEKMTQAIAEYFKTQPVVKAWLFGSYARGEERPDSDVDVLVQYDRKQPIGLLKISKMHLSLQNILAKSVDLVDEETLFPWVASNVEREKRLIYERAS